MVHSLVRNLYVLIADKKLYVQYSEDCPDIEEPKSSPGGTKSYKLRVHSIPTNGFQGTLRIIKFVAPEHKR